MSENLQNLYSTTLASGYTAGAGSISVAAAPATGNGTYTMTLVIRDASTKAVKLLFRVTSVSGTTLTGAAEGTDANASSGDLVDGSIISVASQGQLFTDHHGYGTFANLPATTGRAAGDRYKCSDSEYDYIFDGALWVPFAFGSKCTRPDLSTFTNHGHAPDTSDNTTGPVYLERKATGTGYQWVLYTKTMPAKPFKITMGFRGWFDQYNGDQNYYMIVLRESSTGKFWAYGSGDNYDAMGAIFFTDQDNYGGQNPLSVQSSLWNFANARWIRVEDDNTNVNFYVSLDGYHWFKRFSHAHNTTITPNEIGFGFSGHNTTNPTWIMEVFDFTVA